MNEIDLVDFGSSGWIFSLSKESTWGEVRNFYFEMIEDAEFRENGEIIISSPVWGKIKPSERKPAIGEGIAFYHASTAEYPKYDFFDLKRRISLIGKILDIKIEKQSVKHLVLSTHINVLKSFKLFPLLRDEKTENIFNDIGLSGGIPYTFYPVNNLEWSEIKEAAISRFKQKPTTAVIKEYKENIDEKSQIEKLNIAENIYLLGRQKYANSLYEEIIEHSLDSEIGENDLVLIFRSIVNILSPQISTKLVLLLFERIKKGDFGYSQNKLENLLKFLLERKYPNYQKKFLELFEFGIRELDSYSLIESIQYSLIKLFDLKPTDAEVVILDIKRIIVDNRLCNSAFFQSPMSQMLQIEVDSEINYLFYLLQKECANNLSKILDVEIYFNPNKNEAIANLIHSRSQLSTIAEQIKFLELMDDKSKTLLKQIMIQTSNYYDNFNFDEIGFYTFLLLIERLFTNEQKEKYSSLLQLKINNLTKNVSAFSAQSNIEEIINYLESDLYNIEERDWLLNHQSLDNFIFNEVKKIQSDEYLFQCFIKVNQQIEYLFQRYTDRDGELENINSKYNYYLILINFYLKCFEIIRARLNTLGSKLLMDVKDALIKKHKSKMLKLIRDNKEETNNEKNN